MGPARDVAWAGFESGGGRDVRAGGRRKREDECCDIATRRRGVLERRDRVFGSSLMSPSEGCRRYYGRRERPTPRSYVGTAPLCTRGAFLVLDDTETTASSPPSWPEAGKRGQLVPVAGDRPFFCCFVQFVFAPASRLLRVKCEDCASPAAMLLITAGFDSTVGPCATATIT